MKSFGTAQRIGHDSTEFYKRKMFAGAANTDETETENSIGKYLNSVLCMDSKRMTGIPDSSVHLMVTSPPYNVGKDYDNDLDLDEFIEMLDSVFAETYRVLVNGGRACINIANVGRKPYIPFHKFVIDLMSKNGFLMRGEVIWQKGAGAGTSTAWGSWRSASNPVLRDTHEYILVFSKGKFGRTKGDRKNTITRDEFLEFTKSVWNFGPESAKKANHPAPFPVELPYRCIQMYSFKDDIVLDPFCGSGTTAIASMISDRNYVMIDNNKEYVSNARNRIKKASKSTLPI